MHQPVLGGVGGLLPAPLPPGGVGGLLLPVLCAWRPQGALSQAAVASSRQSGVSAGLVMPARGRAWSEQRPEQDWTAGRGHWHSRWVTTGLGAVKGWRPDSGEGSAQQATLGLDCRAADLATAVPVRGCLGVDLRRERRVAAAQWGWMEDLGRGRREAAAEQDWEGDWERGRREVAVQQGWEARDSARQMGLRLASSVERPCCVGAYLTGRGSWIGQQVHDKHVQSHAPGKHSICSASTACARSLPRVPADCASTVLYACCACSRQQAP